MLWPPFSFFGSLSFVLDFTMKYQSNINVQRIILLLFWHAPIASRAFSVSRAVARSSKTPLAASTQEEQQPTATDKPTNNVDGKDAYYYYSPNVPLTNDDQAALNDQGEEGGFAPGATSATNEYSFFDEAIIYVRAGSGGQGANTYKRIGQQQGPPDGGNGGNGGNVVLMVDPSLNTLAGLTTAWRPNAYGGSGAAASSATRRRKTFHAEKGADGERFFRDGKTGKDVVIRVPSGTVVEEQIVSTSSVNEAQNAANDLDDHALWVPLGSLANEEDTLIVARGGEGGEGTGVQKQRGVRRPRLPSTGGERKVLKLTLKIVADVALVGVPNAGTFLLLARRWFSCAAIAENNLFNWEEHGSYIPWFFFH